MKTRYELPDRNQFRREFEALAETRSLAAREIAEYLDTLFTPLASRPTVKSRVKDFDSYFKKHLRLLRNSEAPEMTEEITDLIGIRVVCPFIEDLVLAEDILKKELEVIEVERKGSDYSFKEFGYESTHLLVKIPGAILDARGSLGTEVAEIQIRTILQDAWAEVEHELVYKAEFTPFDDPLRRKLAAVNASLSLADIVFQEIRDYQRRLNGELGKRRDSFYKKIEEFTDDFLFDEIEPGGDDIEAPALDGQGSNGEAFSGTIDDLLLNALYAHNKRQFDRAIAFYSRILDMKSDDPVKSLIHKHRGMAHFAQSRYGEAVEDFSRSLELDPKSYKASYYRGVVHSVLKEYDKAIDDFTRSLSINPYQHYCLYRRAQAYYHLGDYPGALADCESALVLEPSVEPIIRFRDVLRNKLKM
ncbi:MAG: tetratricopeptide repeat protein [Spirochaetaceae bacterium]|jgi:putative GTP pyrophosphokinase|nr:tetratricopeptide repeat protein [Spirochaetaceae bacterium]